MPQHRLDARSFSFRRGALVGAALLATASLGGCGTPESAPDTATSIATVPAPASSPAVALASEATQRNTLGTAALPPPSAPDGTWYLAANGARQVLQVTANADRTRDATLADEATGAVRACADVRWDAASGSLRFTCETASGSAVYDTVVVGAILTGRFAQTASGVAAATAFDAHVTGWNSTVLDTSTVPRVFSMHWSDGRQGTLRIDREAAGSDVLVGRIKVVALVGDASAEDAERDLSDVRWDGVRLSFTVAVGSVPWRYEGTAAGRLLEGTATATDGTSATFRAERAEVLTHGLTPRPPSVADVWRSGTRRMLSRLLMADAPAPRSTTVTPLGDDVAPFVATPFPGRDDDTSQPQAYTLRELRLDHALADAHGSGSLTRSMHVWVATPTTPAPPRGFPVVVAVNGHYGSAHAVMDPSSMYWYGDGYARRGYVVVAVDISHRPVDERHGLYADLLGGDDPGNGNGMHPSIASPGFDSDFEEDGERVWDTQRALDYALSLPGVDRSSVLVTGLSMGGEVSTLAAALEPRFTGLVAAGFSPDLAVMRLHGNHPCWRWAYADNGEYVDVSDLHALVAPRTVVIETGTADTTYSFFTAPFASDKQVLRRSRAAFAGPGGGRLTHYLHDGAHVYRVGDPSMTARGITVPQLIAPATDADVAWELSALTRIEPLSLFDLTVRAPHR